MRLRLLKSFVVLVAPARVVIILFFIQFSLLAPRFNLRHLLIIIFMCNSPTSTYYCNPFLYCLCAFIPLKTLKRDDLD